MESGGGALTGASGHAPPSDLDAIRQRLEEAKRVRVTFGDDEAKVRVPLADVERLLAIADAANYPEMLTEARDILWDEGFIGLAQVLSRLLVALRP